MVHALQQKHTPYTRGCLGRAFLQPPPRNEESRLHSHPGLPWWSQKLVPLETEKSMRLRLCLIITETHPVCILYTATYLPFPGLGCRSRCHTCCWRCTWADQHQCSLPCTASVYAGHHQACSTQTDPVC